MVVSWHGAPSDAVVLVAATLSRNGCWFLLGAYSAISEDIGDRPKCGEKAREHPIAQERQTVVMSAMALLLCCIVVALAASIGVRS